MNRVAGLAATLLAVLVPLAPSHAAEGPADRAAELVGALLAAKDGAGRRAAIDASGAAAPDASLVAAALERGRTYAADVPKGWLRKSILAPDGKERPYLLHVPAGYDPAKRWRLVVDMHGGVSRPQVLDHAGLEDMKFAWGAQAEKDGWILAYPAGERGCVWWDAVGSGMVLDLVRETKRAYNVDDDAVFATGFSDGGSGSWFLANSRCTPFAGFVPLNGHPSVAGMGGTQIHLPNVANRPVYAVNTDLDSLYPSAGVKPVVDALLALGAPLVWRDVKGFGHDPSYLETERPAVVTWMDGVRRDPAPRAVRWEGAAGEPARVDWLRVTRVTGGSGKDPFPDANPLLTDARVRLGVMIDQEFGEKGARIQSVNDGSLAKAMGLAAGDVIVAIDGADVAGGRELRALLAKKAPGDEIAVKARRGEETVERKAKVPPAKSEPAFDRSAPWGTIRAEAKGNRIDVACLGIGAFEVMLTSRSVDLSKPVEVAVNGAVVSSAVAVPDLRFLCEQWAEDEDRSAVYVARVAVTVPAAAKAEDGGK